MLPTTCYIRYNIYYILYDILCSAILCYAIPYHTILIPGDAIPELDAVEA